LDWIEKKIQILRLDLSVPLRHYEKKIPLETEAELMTAFAGTVLCLTEPVWEPKQI
jgi:hypothetical protein